MKRVLFVLLWIITNYCSLSSGRYYPWYKSQLIRSLNVSPDSKVPGRPGDVSCKELPPKGIFVTWEPPSAFNGTVAGYNVYYYDTRDDRHVFKKTTTANKMMLHGLSIYTDYSIQVVAFSEHGNGLRSRSVTCDSYEGENICAPLEVESTTNKTITVKWKCKGNSTAGYNVRYFSLSTPEQTYNFTLPSGDLASNTLTGLNHAETYEISMEAYDKNDEPLQIEVIRSTVGGIVPTRPCKLKLEITNKTYDSATVEWECETANGSPIEGYKLQVRRGYGRSFGHMDVTDVQSGFTTYTLKNLDCGQQYQITIEAYNKDGTYGDHSAVKTKLGDQVSGPPPPSDEVLETGEDRVMVKLDSWKFNCPNGVFVAYISNEVDEFYREPDKVNMTVSKRLMITQLQPNTEYTLKANNEEGERFEHFWFKTLCDNKTRLSETPRKKDVIDEGSTYVTIHLNKFTCFTEFSVEYRENSETSWKLISNDIPVDQKRLIIQQLTPGESYKLRITGRYKYGESTAEYSVNTNDNACGDWIQLNRRCVKIIKEAGRLVKSEAQKVCHKMQEDEDPVSLLTIRSEDEVERLTDILRLNASLDSVWLGLQSADSHVYHWDDGSEVFFTGWSLSPYEKEQRCAKVYLKKYESLMLAKANCNSRNYVACEKPHPWNLSKLRKEFANLQEAQMQAHEKIKNLELQLKS